jgi:hypothetical protein
MKKAIQIGAAIGGAILVAGLGFLWWLSGWNTTGP